MSTPADPLRALIDAAILWAYCPKEGGYKDGRSIEDTCEQLAEAVEAFTGVPQPDAWWTEEEMRAALATKPAESGVHSRAWWEALTPERYEEEQRRCCGLPIATKPAETLTAAHPARRLAVALNALDFYLTDHAPELRDSWEPLIEACFAALATKPAETPALDEDGCVTAEEHDRVLALRRASGHPTESAGKSPEAADADQAEYEEECARHHREWEAEGTAERGAVQPPAPMERKGNDGLPTSARRIYGDEPISEQWSPPERREHFHDDAAYLTAHREAGVQPPAPEPFARVLYWCGPQYMFGQHEKGRTIARTFDEYPKSAEGQMYWREGELLYRATPSIAQPEPPAPEPAAWRYRYHKHGAWHLAFDRAVLPCGAGNFEQEPLYTTPPASEQRGAALTRALEQAWVDCCLPDNLFDRFVRALALSPERPD